MASNYKIFTTGYTGKDINDLKPLLETLDAMLIDIRFSPFSQVLHWRKIYLKALLGERYRHIANLGNRTFKHDKITIQNLELGVKTILGLPSNLVLMCVCKDQKTCHRRVVVEELTKQNIESHEISIWKTSDPSVQSELFSR